MRRRPYLTALLLLTLALWTSGTTPATAYTSAEVSQLVAPVALYPDPLLSNVLSASTYPDEVLLAYQWVQHNGALQPAQVPASLASVNWDPSVKSMTAFPNVLTYEATNMEWTEALGNAFLTQPDAVEAAIQNLRLAAQQNGALQSNAQVLVTDVSGAVVIESANPQYIYVPSYDYDTEYYDGWSPIEWGPGCDVGMYLWMGCFDWRYNTMYCGQGYNYYYQGNLPSSNAYYRRIRGNVSQRRGAWQFNQAHRRGRAVPSVAQLNQGRGFATPSSKFSAPVKSAARTPRSGRTANAAAAARTTRTAKAAATARNTRTAKAAAVTRTAQAAEARNNRTRAAAATHTARVAAAARTRRTAHTTQAHATQTSALRQPRATHPAPHAAALRAARPAAPRSAAPRRASTPHASSLYDVRPGSSVNVERSQGAESRHSSMPASVRPIAHQALSRPSYQRSVPMPQPRSAPMQQRSAPMQQRSAPMQQQRSAPAPQGGRR